MGGKEDPNASPTPTPTPDSRKELMDMLRQTQYSGGKSVSDGVYRSYSGNDQKRKIKETAKLLNALHRIGIVDLAQPPDYLGEKYQPRYVLPQYPPTPFPEDVNIGF